MFKFHIDKKKEKVTNVVPTPTRTTVSNCTDENKESNRNNSSQTNRGYDSVPKSRYENRPYTHSYRTEKFLSQMDSTNPLGYRYSSILPRDEQFHYVVILPH